MKQACELNVPQVAVRSHHDAEALGLRGFRVRPASGEWSAQDTGNGEGARVIFFGLLLAELLLAIYRANNFPENDRFEGGGGGAEVLQL